MNMPCLTSHEQGMQRSLGVLPVQYRIKTARSLYEMTRVLRTLQSRWELRRWDADLPQTYLLSCEDFAAVSACLATHDILSEIQFEQDFAACISMAVSHGMAYCQVMEMMEGEGNQIQEYEVRIQGIEVLATLLGRKQGRLRHHEEAYRAYCRGFERFYQEVFVQAFYTAHTALQARDEEKEEAREQTAFDAFLPQLERDKRCAI
jgi:hypothetical protein